MSALAASMPPPSTQLETTFVAVSSSAERASDGTITACAGRVMVTAVAATTAPAYTNGTGASIRIATAVAPMPAACAT